MPVYTLQGPDGRTYTIEGPEGATADQLGAFVMSQAGKTQAPSEPIQEKRGGFAQDLGNLGAGAVRGAGSLGATLLAPYDMMQDAIAGKGLSLESNRQRRADMDAGLSQMGAQPDSFLYKAGKLGAEVAGTMGTGGLAANALTKVAPSAAAAAPGLIEALRTGGMSANGATGIGGMATRMAGGAITGGLSAGLVDPAEAKMGALIGGVAPVVVKGAGMIGEKISERSNQRLADALRDFERSAPRNQTIEESIKAGYVIPPATVDPSYKNRLLESISGKQATQQLASARNSKVTDDLVRQSLGLADNAPLTQGALEDLRRTAGGAYKEVADLSPQAAADLEALKVARNEAQGWFKAYNRSARPDDLAKAKEARALSESLEKQLESYAAAAGKENLIPALQDARKQIAKTYTVGRALNDASGTVDARILGRMHEKGMPLSDGLDVAGRFASAFPTVAKTSQQVGSADTHNLKTLAALLMGGGGAAATGGAGVVAGAVPFVAPSLARSLMFREGAQQALVPQMPQAGNAAKLAELLRNPQAQELLLRSAPVMGASSGP